MLAFVPVAVAVAVGEVPGCGAGSVQGGHWPPLTRLTRLRTWAAPSTAPLPTALPFAVRVVTVGSVDTIVCVRHPLLVMSLMTHEA
jgi:hypothetical protein